MNNQTKSQKNYFPKRRESDDNNAVAIVKKIQMHSFLKVERLGETRSRKSWNQCKGYHSPSLRYAMRSESSSSVKSLRFQKFDDMSHEETERKQRCAQIMAWNLAKTFATRSKRIRQQKSRRREFLVDSGASMHMVSKRDLNSAELVTMRTTRGLTTVMTANGEVQTREDTTVYVKHRTWLSKFCFLKKLPQFFSSGSSARIMGIHTTGPAVKNHISPEMARELMAIFPTMYQQIHRKSSTWKKWKYGWGATDKPDSWTNRNRKQKMQDAKKYKSDSIAWIAGWAAGVQREFGWWT